MITEKEQLIKNVPGLYAVGELRLEGERYYGAASENRDGKVFLIHADTGAVSELEGGRGGVMAVLEAEGEQAMLCIEEFYPVFDSATAKIVKVMLERRSGGWTVSGRKLVAKVPYVHRIAQLKEEDGVFIAAGKLCERKACSDDWSTAGSMEIGRYDPEAGVTSFERVQDGIYKHHAMFVRRREDGFDDLYYGGSEGAFLTTRENGAWVTKKLLSVPVSDLVCLDLDQDGKNEIAIIEEFHGDKAVLFKEKENGYERVLELPLNFGHVLWGGSFLGSPGLITGSRGGEKELILYRFASDTEKGLCVREKTVVDRGQAPAQITVYEAGENAVIAAANHGAAQLTRYRCCLECQADKR